VSPLGNGDYALFSAVGGKALEDPNFSTANGAILDLSPFGGGINMHWTLFPV
jgi:hypothetical protein